MRRSVHLAGDERQGLVQDREVPLNALVRQVLDEWLEVRKDISAEGERALFVSRTGGIVDPLGRPRRPRAALQRAVRPLHGSLRPALTRPPERRATPERGRTPSRS